MNRGNRGPIFLVEDNADDEALIIRALKKANIQNEIIIAHDGVEALDRLLGDAAFQPALILLDLKLPKINGIEVLQKLRAVPRTQIIPIVIMTSSDEQEDMLRSYKSGVNSYVRKPVEFSQFAKVVSQLGLYWLLVNEAPPKEPEQNG